MRDVCLEHQKYLGFAWKINSIMKYFTFTVWPFGLSCACFCFTKVLRPLVKRWRSMGYISLFFYLDDGFGSQPDKCSASAAAIIPKLELISSWFFIDDDKSIWQGMQLGEWLGFVINTISISFHIPERKA